MHTLPLTWHGHRFELLAQKGVHWPATRSLIVADVHFGKADHFQHAGIPIPAGTTEANLRRLDAMLHATAAERLIVLGDLFHAPTGLSKPLRDRLAQWRQQHTTLTILVVPGNHDRNLHDATPDLRLQWVAPIWHEAHLTFRHDPPAEMPQQPTLVGHVHPAVRLRAPGRPSLKLPCFCFGDTLAHLPAFGTFTGTHTIRPKPTDQIIAIHPQAHQLINLTPSPNTRP